MTAAAAWWDLRCQTLLESSRSWDFLFVSVFLRGESVRVRMKPTPSAAGLSSVSGPLALSPSGCQVDMLHVQVIRKISERLRACCRSTYFLKEVLLQLHLDSTSIKFKTLEEGFFILSVLVWSLNSAGFECECRCCFVLYYIWCFCLNWWLKFVF